MIYQVLFFTGAIGFILMALFGFLSGHSGGHSGSAVGSHGPAIGHGPHAGVSHGGGAHGHLGGPRGPIHNTAHGESSVAPHTPGTTMLHWAQSAGWLLVSPLDLFALATGAGLTGIFLRHQIANGPLTAIGALCGALVFDFLLLKPLINLMFKAASPPSEGLEGTVSKTAVAATNFDRSGKGLIKLILDGQTVQLLGNLDQVETKSGVTVCKGDSVIILEVDAKRNVCRVSREIAN